MSDWIIYHNPKCSKSRETLALLQKKGVKPTVIEYLNTPPSVSTLRTLLSQLGKEASEIVRTKEEEYSRLSIDWSKEEQVLDTLSRVPKLMERPIVVHGNRAVIGRPPENVLSLFEK